jgi:hypothetical protein
MLDVTSDRIAWWVDAAGKIDMGFRRTRSRESTSLRRAKS